MGRGATMNETTTNERQRELDEIKRRYPEMYYVTTAVMLIGVGVAVGYVLFADREGFSANLFTETISVAVTVLILNRLAERRDEKRETKRLKENLIAQMGSQVNEVAVHAVEELRRHGWLTDGSLNGANLAAAHLEGANLMFARLTGATLNYAHLEGAFLAGAHLEGAGLHHTQFSTDTALPWGNHWTPETDMRCFTDPNHPNFWRPPDNE